MHAAARRLFGAAERSRDLRVTDIQILALHQRDTLFRWQGFDEALDLTQEITGVEPSVVVPARGRNALHGLLSVQGAEARRLALVAQERVRRNAIEPCAMVGITGQPVPGPIGLERGFLIEIVRVRPVAR